MEIHSGLRLLFVLPCFMIDWCEHNIIKTITTSGFFMENTGNVIEKLNPNHLPFPAEWIKSNPRKVEEALSRMPVADQVLAVLQLQGKDRLDLVMLSPQSLEVVQALPPEEIYYMVKDMDRNECLLLLSVVSQDQLQYIFDIEWWSGDKFLPQRALEWLTLLDQCDDSQILDWFLTEEFDQKVMMLQSLIKVFKRDDLTDDYQGVENLPHFTIDNIYDIFIKINEAEPILKKHLPILFEKEPKIYLALMEATMWDILTQTVESAYRWRLARTAERGIPEFEEAFSIYSQLNPEALSTEPASPEYFSEGGKYLAAPRYPLAHANTSTFFCKCLAQLTDAQRIDSIRWELVYLANKVIVADKRDLASLDVHQEVMRKVLGYVNIGLELGAGEDIAKGGKLLDRSWLQALFQVGYGRLMQLKWQAETLLKEQGTFLQKILTPAEQDHLGGLVGRFPQVPIFVDKGEPYKWRNPESFQDVHQAENFLYRAGFIARFSKMCLGLSERELDRISTRFDYPEEKHDLDFILLTTTAFARYTLFNELSCDPLPDVAATSFIKMIFLPSISKSDPKVCDQVRIDRFKTKLLQTPITWTNEDKALLEWLIREITQNLKVQFARVQTPIQWQYTHALLIRLTGKTG